MLEEGHHELRAAKAERFAAWSSARRRAAAVAADTAAAAAKAAATAAASSVPAGQAVPSQAKPSAFHTPADWARVVTFPPASAPSTGEIAGV